MPKRGQTNAITAADRQRYTESFARLQEMDPDLTMESLGRQVGLSKSQVSKIFSGESKQSVRKQALDRALGIAPEEAPVVRKIVGVAIKLDYAHQQRLLERAVALLEEQSGKR